MQHAGVQRGIDHVLATRRLDLTALEPLMQLAVQRFRAAQKVCGMLQCADRIAFRRRAVATGEHRFQRRIALGTTDDGSHFGIQRIRRPLVTTPQRENDHAQQPAENPVGEVAQQLIQGALRFAEGFFHRPTKQRRQRFGVIQIVIALERRRGQVHVAQHIAQPRRQTLAAFQLAPQQHHAQVGEHGERCRLTIERAEITLAQAISRHALEMPEAQIEHQRAGRVTHREADVLQQQVIEFLHRLVTILTPGEGHFLQDERMAANGALTKDHQVARQNVRAFHRDENRRALP